MNIDHNHSPKTFTNPRSNLQIYGGASFGAYASRCSRGRRSQLILLLALDLGGLIRKGIDGEISHYQKPAKKTTDEEASLGFIFGKSSNGVRGNRRSATMFNKNWSVVLHVEFIEIQYWKWCLVQRAGTQNAFYSTLYKSSSTIFAHILYISHRH